MADPTCNYCGSRAHLGCDHLGIRTHYRKLLSQTEWEIVAIGYGRWIRLFATYGEPPGSHIGLWHTRTGTVHGWNLRIGKRYSGPCLTLLAHTRKVRAPTHA